MVKYFAIMSPVHGLKTVQAKSAAAALEFFKKNSCDGDVLWLIQYYAAEHPRVRQMIKVGYRPSLNQFWLEITCVGDKPVSAPRG